MALSAGIQTPMLCMTEWYNSGIFDNEVTVGWGELMTFFAICSHAKRSLAIVTCTAGFTLLHLWH